MFIMCVRCSVTFVFPTETSSRFEYFSLPQGSSNSSSWVVSAALLLWPMSLTGKCWTKVNLFDKVKMLI